MNERGMFHVKSGVEPIKMESDWLEHLPWVEKYRPESLNDVISQEHIVQTCKGLGGQLPEV